MRVHLNLKLIFGVYLVLGGKVHLVTLPLSARSAAPSSLR